MGFLPSSTAASIYLFERVLPWQVTMNTHYWYGEVTTRSQINRDPNRDKNHYTVRPPEKIGNLSASRPCLRVRSTVFTVWSAAGILESELLQDTEKTV